jgi:hypothetical protein
MMWRNSRVALGTGWLSAWLFACLPADTRPPPAELTITVTPDQALVEGIETSDGWTVTFTRFLLSIGHVSAEGDSCIGYSDPDYSRVLRMTQPGAQKVGLLFALGQCEFDYELSSPREDSVLGANATEADKALMRTPGTNLFALDSGTSILAEGTAAKAGVTKTFSWAFRQRIDYAACQTIIDGRVESGVDLEESESASVDIAVVGATLFQEALGGERFALGFQPFADADGVTGNGDGDVSFGELRAVLLADISAEGRFTDPEIAAEAWSTLEDYVYLGLFPRILRFRGDGTCEQEIFPNDRVPR